VENLYKESLDELHSVKIKVSSKDTEVLCLKDYISMLENDVNSITNVRHILETNLQGSEEAREKVLVEIEELKETLSRTESQKELQREEYHAQIDEAKNKQLELQETVLSLTRQAAAYETLHHQSLENSSKSSSRLETELANCRSEMESVSDTNKKIFLEILVHLLVTEIYKK
jgi:chromosome segregation ATPase